MKTYKITSNHEVNVDDYENGELEHVNSYILTEEIKAENLKNAIKEYFQKILCYSFNFEDAQIDEENNEFLDYSVLVDENNFQAEKYQIDQWKKGKLKLYSNLIRVYAEELKTVKF